MQISGSISVIIPTYNRALDLKRCLQSVLEQTYKNFEVIVCDDGSTDNTQEMVSNFTGLIDIKYIKSKNAGGPARPRNLGINIAKGEYIAFLDSDDWWKKEKLEESILALTKDNDLVYHDLWIAHKENQNFFFKKSKSRKLQKPVFKDLLLYGNGLNNSSVVVRRSLLNKIGNIDENADLIAGEDYDYWLRISKETDKFYRIPKTLGYYWLGGGNISNQLRTNRIIEYLLNKYQKDFQNLSNSDMDYPLWIYKTKVLHDLELNQIRRAFGNWKHIPVRNFITKTIYLIKILKVQLLNSMNTLRNN